MMLVLLTGVDRALATARKRLLEKAGHTVVPALSEPALVSLCQQQQFDVAVIGHAIPRREKHRVLVLIRQHAPSAKVLELYSEQVGKVLEAADAWLAVGDDVPHDLPALVAALAKRRSAKRQSK